MTDETSRRLAHARGNAEYGGRLSSLGAVGSPIMKYAITGRSDGRASWIGRPKFATQPFSSLDENGVDVVVEKVREDD